MRWFKSSPRPTGFVVSIGAGTNQVPLIQEAKKLGFSVIGVDMNAHAPGFPHCDLKVQESIESHEQIYTTLREFLLDGEVRAVMTKSYGTAIRTVAYLAEQFGTPFIPYERTTSFIDKGLMKKVFMKSSILTPAPVALPPAGSRKKDIVFPLIVKPAVGHAKTGVRMVGNQSDLARIKRPGRTGTPLILERYLPGPEIIAIGAIHERRYHLVEITDKELLPGTFIDLRHSAPTCHGEHTEAVIAAGQAVADAFHIDTAPLVTEFVIHEGRPYLIEAVPEFGGEFLTDVLIPAHSGYRLVTELLRATTGLGFLPPQACRRANAVVVRYITGAPGTLVSVTPDGAQSIKGVIFTQIFKEIGAEIRRPQSNHDRIGVIVAVGPSIDEAERRAVLAIEKLNVTIR